MKRALQLTAWISLSLAALGFAAWAIPLSEYKSNDASDVHSETIAVVQRENDLALPAVIALRWSDGQSLTLGGSGGLVTQIVMSPKTEIACGTGMIEVDGRMRFAYCAPRPMWKEIDISSSASESADFVEFLRLLGFLPRSGKQPSSQELRRAIRTWQTSTNQPVNGIARPTDVVWIGPGPATPTVISVRVGELLEPYATVAQVEPELTSAIVQDFVPSLDGSDRVAGVDGSTARVDVAADGSIEALSALETALRVTGALVDGLPENVPGSTRLAEAQSLATVPATSLLSGSAGSCVIVVAADGSLHPSSVIPVDASIGVVFVTGDVEPGDLIQVNPDRAAGC